MKAFKSALLASFPFLLPTLGLEAAQSLIVNASIHPFIDQIPVSTYQLETVRIGAEENAAQMQRAADYVRESLNEKGLREAAVGETPDLFVSLSCGVIGPRTISKIIDYDQISGVSSDGGGGFLNREALERWRWREYQEDANGKLLISGHKAWDSQFNGIPDVDSGSLQTHKVYDKFVYLSGRVLVDEGTGKKSYLETWRVVTTKTDGRKTLHTLLPVLAATSGAFIGESTSGQEKVKVKLVGKKARLLE